MKNSNFYRHNLLFILNFIKSFPKITLRFLSFLFQRKKMTCKIFGPDSSYCIEGTLNQLIWEVENTVFITLSNSSKIFFDSGELLFHVNAAQTQFQLCTYGVGRKQRFEINLKVVLLEKKDLTNVITKSKSVVVDLNRIVRNPNIDLQHINNHSISFQKSLKPKSPEEIKIKFTHTQFLNQYTAAIFNTISIEEVQKLKQLIDKNQRIA